MEWEFPDKIANQSQSSPDSFRIALLASLVLHGLLIALLFSVRTQQVESSVPGLIQINFVPNEMLPPQVTPAPIEQIAESSLVELETAAELESPVPQTAESVAEIERFSEPLPSPQMPVEIEVPAIAVSPETGPAEQGETIVPNSMAIRQLVNSISEQETDNGWQFDCTEKQKNSELIKCEDDDNLAFNAAARYFLTSQPDNSARRAQAFIGQNAASLRSSLNSTSLDTATTDMLIENIEAGISVYANSGNAPVERLTNQIYTNDPAYQQMRQVMEAR